VKLAFLNPSGNTGGAERVLLDLLWSLRRRAPEVETHLILGESGPLERAAADLGAKVRVLPFAANVSGVGDSALRTPGSKRSRLKFLANGVSTLPATLRYVRQLRRELDRIRPDLVHSNGMKMHLLAGPATWNRHPLVWHVHDFPSLRPMAGRLLRRLSRFPTAAIAISRAVEADLRRSCPKLRRVTTILNAIDVERFCPGPGDPGLLDRLAGLPDRKPAPVRVGLIATYARWKGQDLFIRAASRLMASSFTVPVRFYLIGGPIYRTAGSQFSTEELRTMAANAGLEGHLGMIPFQADPLPIYRALDVVVHASTLPEPFGLTIAEAMSCGRCVAVANAGGAAESIRSGVDGIATVPGSVDSLTEVLTQLVRSPSKRDAVARAARETALRAFDRNRLAGEFLQLARSICPKSVN